MHTKTKGDIGELRVIAFLLEKGYNVLKPVGDNLPYDIVIERDGIFKRGQCKYRREINGCFEIQNGNHNQLKRQTVTYTEKVVDFYAIYCPNTNMVYYLRVNELKHIKYTFRLRIKKSKMNINTVRMAEKFTDPCRIFE